MADDSGLGSSLTETDYGQEYFRWQIDEYPRYHRGPFWYIFMIGGGIALVIYSLVTANFLFALIIIMFAMIMYLTSLSPSRKIDFAITDAGIVVGETLYPYRDIRRFWFIYEPPEVKSIYFEFKNALRPRMNVDLGTMNPNVIRDAIGRFVKEDFNEDEEPISDYLARIFKL
jgi:hypothetical protein